MIPSHLSYRDFTRNDFVLHNHPGWHTDKSRKLIEDFVQKNPLPRAGDEFGEIEGLLDEKTARALEATSASVDHASLDKYLELAFSLSHPPTDKQIKELSELERRVRTRILPTAVLNWIVADYNTKDWISWTSDTLSTCVINPVITVARMTGTHVLQMERKDLAEFEECVEANKQAATLWTEVARSLDLLRQDVPGRGWEDAWESDADTLPTNRY